MAIGYLECAGYAAALYAMDKACKSVDITILGIDTINPKDSSAPIPLTTQVKFEGSVSEVAVAVEIATQAALTFNKPDEVLGWVNSNPSAGTRKLCEISKVKLK